MFNEESVCIKCWNRDNDKTECMDKCERLHAFQQNQPWYHIAPYIQTVTQEEAIAEVMEQKEEVTITAPMESEEVEQVKKCLIEGCNNVGNRRGLCERHYDSWRKGYIEHPVEGLWFPNRKTRPKKAKKTRKHGISDEALRNVEQSLNAAVKRIEGRQKESRIITIDLCKYDKLYEKIMQESERDYVPISHTIINLLSIGMQVVEMSAKKE